MAIIEDGGFKGTKATVTDDGNLQTDGIVKSQIAYQSQKKSKSFRLSFLSFPITTTEGFVIWGKNISPIDSFIVDKMVYQWVNTTATSFKYCDCKVYVGTGTPSANFSQPSPSGYSGNLNLLSTKTASFDFRYWDGVGTGMTVASTGSFFFGNEIIRGSFVDELDGAFIMPPNAILALSAQGEEAGRFSVNITGHFEKL